MALLLGAPSPYPTARRDRTVTVQRSAATRAAAIELPVPRILPLAFNGGNDKTSVIVLGPFAGPGLIDEFAGRVQGNTGGNTPSIAFYWSDEGTGAGVDLAKATVPTGKRINDALLISESSASTHVDTIGWPLQATSPGSTEDMVHFPLRFPVYLDRWFCKVRISAPAASTGQMYGWLRIFERVPWELYPNFL